MSLIRFIAGLLIVLSGSLAASADTIYTVTVSVPILPSFNGTFVFSEPSILTTFTAISPADIASSGPALSSILIDPEGLGCPHSSPSVPNPVSCMEVRYAGGGFVVGDFAELLTAPGTYSVPNLTLVVTRATDAGGGIVPEPTSLLLLATGILGALGSLPIRGGQAGPRNFCIADHTPRTIPQTERNGKPTMGHVYIRSFLTHKEYDNPSNWDDKEYV